MARTERCPACDGAVEMPSGGEGRLRCPDCGEALEARGDRLYEARRDRFRDSPEDDPPPRRSIRRSRYDDDDDDHGPWRTRYTANASDRVKGPAILLQVTGILLAVAAVALGAFSVFVVASAPGGGGGDDAAVAIVLFGGSAAASLAVGGFTWWAGWRVGQMRSHVAGVVASIGLLVFGFLFCLPVAFVGIWPLVVLMDSNVKEAFREAEEREAGRERWD